MKRWQRWIGVLLLGVLVGAPAFATVHVTEQYFEKDANGFAKVRSSAPFIEFFNTSTFLTSAASATLTISVESSTGFAAGDHVYVGTNAAVLVSSVPGATSITLATAVTSAAYSAVVLKRDVSASATTDDYEPLFRDSDSGTTISQPFRADTNGQWQFWIDVGTFGRRVSTSTGTTLSLTNEVSYSVAEAAAGIASDVQCSGSCVALTTETSGNYVATVAASTAMDVTGADAEGATKTVAWDSTEVQDTTWGASATLPFIWTFDGSAFDFLQSYETNGFTVGRSDASTEISVTAGDTDSRGSVRLSDGSANYTKIRSASGMSADYTLDLPVDDGVAGQTLQTDGAGVLTWADRFTTVFKPADESVGNATFQADDDLTFTVLANTNYSFRITMYYTTPTAADLKVQLTGPASPTLLVFQVTAVVPGGSTVSPAAVATSFGTDTTGCTAGTCAQLLGGTTLHGVGILTGILQNGANAGSVTVSWAQFAQSGTSKVFAGSTLEWKKL